MQVTVHDIKEASDRITPYIRHTPLIYFDYLSNHCSKEIWLKCETLQRTGSFKIRGAANCILANLAHAKKDGVIAASAGNHAQAVAAIAKFLGIKATIVMPQLTPFIKIQNTRNWGASIELVGSFYDESFEHAKKISQERGLLLIHPYKDPHVIAGQGTLALELVNNPDFKEIEAVVVSVGGGGLACGVAIALKALRPDIKIYGVTASYAPAAFKSFHKKKAVSEAVSYTLAEGVAVKKTDEKMLTLMQHNLEDIFSLSEEAIAHAIAILAEQGKLISEGAGALSVAACLENMIPEKKIALILSGGNIDLPVLAHVLQRGLVQQDRLVRLVLTISDRPGVLHSITEIIAKHQANIVEVFHKRTLSEARFGDAEVETDLETRGKDHTREIIDALTAAGFNVRREL